MTQNWGAWELAITSELTAVEARRTLDRMRVKGRLGDPDLANMKMLLRTATERFREIRMTPAILERAASPFSAPLGTLDAIHLATALAWVEETGDQLTVVTHDRELAIAAQASGLDVVPKPVWRR
ncbi:MAG: type II toxin-antitoxin system VapC family toxin, partial [Pseudomonadota bacterium]|jgi:predicted nucleic acid-binding protein